MILIIYYLSQSLGRDDEDGEVPLKEVPVVGDAGRRRGDVLAGPAPLVSLAVAPRHEEGVAAAASHAAWPAESARRAAGQLKLLQLLPGEQPLRPRRRDGRLRVHHREVRVWVRGHFLLILLLLLLWLLLLGFGHGEDLGRLRRSAVVPVRTV